MFLNLYHLHQLDKKIPSRRLRQELTDKEACDAEYELTRFTEILYKQIITKAQRK